MKRVFKQIFIGLSIVVCMCESASAAPIRIVVYGDSLTSGYQLGPDDGYPAKLQKKLKDLGYQDIQVINLSVPGETTAEGLERLSSVEVKRPDIVLLELGVNDNIGGMNMGLINNNLGYMIGKLQQDKMLVVLLGVAAPPNMGPGYVQQMAEVYASLAKGYQIALVPDILDGVTGNSGLTLADGFHPNSAGVDVIVENTFRTVDGALRSKWNEIQEREFEKSQQTTPVGQPLPQDIIAPSGIPPTAR